MKLCLLGNSHAACFIAAWRDMPAVERNGANITMFVVSGNDIATLVERNGRLVLPDETLHPQFIRSSNGLTEIVPQDYDAFALVGMRYGFRPLMRMMREYSTIEIAGERKGATLLSAACLNACIDDSLVRTPAMNIRTLVGSVTDKPVILIPTPCQIEMALEEADRNVLPLRKTGELGRFYRHYVQRSHALAKKRDFTFIPQAPRTMIAGGGYTLNEYGRGGVKYGRTEEKAKVTADDQQHMNAQFGRIALDNLLHATRNP